MSVHAFHADVRHVAAALPAAEHVVNLCRDRYRFTVAFFAACLRQQINLLPGQQTAGAIERLRQEYPRTAVIGDDDSSAIDHIVAFEAGAQGEEETPGIPLAQTVAVAFTSGSTGQPRAHAKSWRMLSSWRHVHHHVLREAAPERGEHTRQLVATVPSWHMYGLEWAMLLPTVAPIAFYSGADFFPQDIARAIESYDGESLLVSTPVHLRALLRAARRLPPVTATMSATAPIEAGLVHDTEARLHTRVVEIYGCSEVGSLASRLPAHEETWRFFPCFRVIHAHDATRVHADELAQPVTLSDRFVDAGEQRLRLIGRESDIVKIGGKRESLAHLNSMLLGIDGVQDAVYYNPAALGLPDTGRLAALVVAPDREANAIRMELARRIDPVFLPRPLRLVQRLPRTATSKLTMQELKAAVEQTDG